jgi:thiopurine S-methyltransferase
MHHDFWLNKWNTMEIGFHQAQINPVLPKLWRRYMGQRQKVFVPLCGASIDMMWFLEQEIEVVGVELSEKAVAHFFQNHNLSFEVATENDFVVYKSDGITIYVGDFFKFLKFDGIDCIYDRASLIALPADMRAKYAEKIVINLKHAHYMLLSLSFEREELGPPFQNVFGVDEVQTVTTPATIHADQVSEVANHVFVLSPKN